MLVDVAIVAIVILSMLAAISQGLLRELFALAGLVLGLVLASWNYARLAIPLGRWIHSPGIANALAFLMIAFGVMLVAGWIGSLLRKTVQLIGLGWLDSILGAVFGIIRGCVVVMVAMIAIAAFRPHASWMQGSKLTPYFLPGAQMLSAQAPAALKEKVVLGITYLKHPGMIFMDMDTMEPVSD